MSHLGIPTFKHIMNKSGKKPTSCSCDKCKEQCHTPCLGTPEDILKIANAGYADRLAKTKWYAGMVLGVIDRPLLMIQPMLESNGWCTFYKDGLCELHDLGLKPTEGKLSHHSTTLENFNPRRCLSWLVAKEWLPLQEELLKEDSK